jgi:hypothetical protein
LTGRRGVLVVRAVQTLPGSDTLPLEPAQPRCCERCGSTRLVDRALAPGEVVPTSAELDSS